MARRSRRSCLWLWHTHGRPLNECVSFCLSGIALVSSANSCLTPPSLSLSLSLSLPCCSFVSCFAHSLLLWFIFCRLPDFRFLNAPFSAAVCPSTRPNPPPFPQHTCVCACVSVLHYQCVCLETRSLKQIYCHSLCTAVNFLSLSFCFTSPPLSFFPSAPLSFSWRSARC